MIQHHQKRLIGIAVIALLTVASCGGDDDTAATTSTAPVSTLAPATAAPSTTAAPETTTTQPTATTAAPETTTTQATTTTVDTNTLASGSGCTPGTDELPDGEWFGYVDAAAADGISFDLACWFSGDAATLAAAEDGEESPPPNDYYVRNVNPDVRELGVADATQVAWLPNVGDPATETTVPYSDWLTGREQRGLDLQPGVWLTVLDGEVTDVREQYVP